MRDASCTPHIVIPNGLGNSIAATTHTVHPHGMRKLGIVSFSLRYKMLRLDVFYRDNTHFMND